MNERELEEADAKRVDEAMNLIKRSSYGEANQILLSVVRNAPKDYRHTTVVGDALYMRFWDQGEFVNFVQKAPPSRQTYWVMSAYPRAYFYLGFISVAEGRFEKAIEYLELGALLEPTNPKFKTEMAHALIKSGRFSEALESVEGISGPGPHVSEEMFATVLRSKGACLIELGDLDQASKTFAQSLEYAPNNKVALNEIQYIRQLAASGKSSSSSITSNVTQFENPVVCKSCGAKNVSGSFGVIGDRRSFTCDKCKLGQSEAVPSKKPWQFWK
jgi:tetratricopeptide (TPR) repeat protein